MINLKSTERLNLSALIYFEEYVENETIQRFF